MPVPERWILWRDKDIDGHWLACGSHFHRVAVIAAERVEVMPVSEHEELLAIHKRTSTWRWSELERLREAAQAVVSAWRHSDDTSLHDEIFALRAALVPIDGED